MISRKIFVILTWIHRVIEISPFIHPNFSYPGGIFVDNFCYPTWEGIWGFVSKYMPYMGTGYDFEGTTTLPNLFFSDFKIIGIYKNNNNWEQKKIIINIY